MVCVGETVLIGPEGVGPELGVQTEYPRTGVDGELELWGIGVLI